MMNLEFEWIGYRLTILLRDFESGRIWCLEIQVKDIPNDRQS